MTFNDNARIDSSRVQRRRGGAGAGAKVAGGGIGSIVLMIVLYFASQALGIDLTPLAGGASNQYNNVSGDQSVSFDNCETGADANRDDECRIVAGAQSLDAYWETQVNGYTQPGVVVYKGSTNSACGQASNAVGPFYCPADESIYIDTDFYELLRSQYGGSSDSLAQMYILSHEWGHHISYITGQLRNTRDSGADSEIVRSELQADCYAGAWVGSAATTKDEYGVQLLKQPTRAELSDALAAAAAVGDDHIQEMAGQRVNPDSFTHGTSEQRQRWFETGYQKGAGACDTFSIPGQNL